MTLSDNDSEARWSWYRIGSVLGDRCALAPASSSLPSWRCRIPAVAAGRGLLVDCSCQAEAALQCCAGHVTIPARHLLRLHLEYIAHLYQKIPPPSEQDRFEVRPRCSTADLQSSLFLSFQVSLWLPRSVGLGLTR